MPIRSVIAKGRCRGTGIGLAETNAPAPDIKVLHAKIGKLTLENDFLEGALIKVGMLSTK
jgi:hypothetical protein